MRESVASIGQTFYSRANKVSWAAFQLCLAPCTWRCYRYAMHARTDTIRWRCASAFYLYQNSPMPWLKQFMIIMKHHPYTFLVWHQQAEGKLCQLKFHHFVYILPLIPCFWPPIVSYHQIGKWQVAGEPHVWIYVILITFSIKRQPLLPAASVHLVFPHRRISSVGAHTHTHTQLNAVHTSEWL